jgi:hypothetical protein
MKTKIFTSVVVVLISFLLNSCYSYQSFVTVEDSNAVPKGSKEIVCNANINIFLSELTKESILYTKFENGYETSEILLDEGTRAKYKILSVDSTIIIMPFWAITEKVAGNIATAQILIAGYSSYRYDANNWSRVIYDVDAKRPKRVFDYGVQLAKKVTNDISYK